MEGKSAISTYNESRLYWTPAPPKLDVAPANVKDVLFPEYQVRRNKKRHFLNSSSSVSIGIICIFPAAVCFAFSVVVFYLCFACSVVVFYLCFAFSVVVFYLCFACSVVVFYLCFVFSVVVFYLCFACSVVVFYLCFACSVVVFYQSYLNNQSFIFICSLNKQHSNYANALYQ